MDDILVRVAWDLTLFVSNILRTVRFPAIAKPGKSATLSVDQQ